MRLECKLQTSLQAVNVHVILFIAQSVKICGLLSCSFIDDEDVMMTQQGGGGGKNLRGVDAANYSNGKMKMFALSDI